MTDRVEHSPARERWESLREEAQRCVARNDPGGAGPDARFNDEAWRMASIAYDAITDLLLLLEARGD